MQNRNIHTQINKVLAELQKESRDLSPVMEVIASLIDSAIQMNFTMKGRWNGSESDVNILSGGTQRWAPLASSTKQKYKKHSYELIATLDRSRGLRSTIEPVPLGKSSVQITANSPYAAIHQHGGTIRHPGGTPFIIDENKMAVFISKDKAFELEAKGMKVRYTKPHSIKIPPRPFLVLTPEDVEDILDVITAYLIR